MSRKLVWICLIIIFPCFLNGQIKGDKSNSENDDVFVATHDWQVVREGQAIPQGLHIRINLQTGLKEAKLLEPEEQSSRNHENNNALSEVKPTEESKKELNPIYSPEELKNILKNIKNDENLPSLDEVDTKRVKTKFKNYEELKKELSNLNMSVKTDAEILQELYEEFKDINLKKNSKIKDDVILDILEQFEYFVHQIDNANEFIKINGLTQIVYKNFNSSYSGIRSEALKILGSCVQNNPSAQIKALETEAVDKVLRLLATESNYDVKKRAVFALSSLLRRFPYAQQQFIKNGGFKVLETLFSKPKETQLQYKIITLLFDLLMEQKILDCSSNDSGSCEIERDGIFEEKLKQYEAIDLKKALEENAWCSIFSEILLNNANIDIEDQDHEIVERVVNLMKLVASKCYYIFRNPNLINLLNKFSDYYFKLFELAKDDNLRIHYSNLFLLIHELVSKIEIVRTEL